MSSWRNGGLALAGVTGLVFLVAGCRGGGAEAGAEGGRTPVVFWHSFVASTIPALDSLVARFEAEHPEIDLQPQYVPTGDALVQKLITAVRSNTAPDVSWIHADYLEDLVAADAIYPMAHFIEGPDGMSDEDLADIYPALLTYASYRGTLYSIPMEATNLGLLYNKDLFREVGLDPERPPATWDELVAFSERLRLDRNGDGRYERIGFMVPIRPGTGPDGPWMVWQFMPFMMQGGNDHLVNEAQTRVLFDGEAGVQALALWERLYDLQNQRRFTNEYQSAFVSRQGAMMLDGPWNLPNYPRLLEGMDWGIAPLPAGPAGPATVVGGEYLAIFRQSEHPEAAWTFVKWVTQPEVQAFWSQQSGYLPVRASVMAVPEYRAYLDQHPGLRAFAEGMAVARAQRPVEFFSLEIQRELAVAIERTTVGDLDARTALAQAAAASNAMLDRADRTPLTQPPPEPADSAPAPAETTAVRPDTTAGSEARRP
jgi:ABC-type glycerol-3-phosphate transport system substrate-binding protein